MLGRARNPLLATLTAVVGLVLAAGPPAAGAESRFAPLNRPGPPLEISRTKLRAALDCQRGVRDADRAPVLLNPATGVTPEQNYSWNWEPALDALGIPWCAYTAPHHTMGDIQRSGQYLVYAIRRMHAMAGRRIAIMGHSQGGMSMRWALRFWPDTRRMVDDVIGFAASNHGTSAGAEGCPGQCPPASWQQGADSRFIAAINSRAETFAGISYSQIYTHTDWVVMPNLNDRGSSALHTGDGEITNVAIQDICPAAVSEHLAVGTYDAVAYALAVDALTHRGPAQPGRIPRSVCLRLAMPGIDPLDLNTYLQQVAAIPGLLAVAMPVNVVGVPVVSAEPRLDCYTLARCSARG